MKKLTPSKMLSSMALATLLVAAAGTQTAQAANFQYNAGNGTQVGGTTDATATNVQSLEGGIEINGTFSKTVTNIPTPSTDGHYLIVSMPLNLSYAYDANTDTLTGSTGIIENHSVKVENGGTQVTPQPIQLKVVNLEEKLNGSSTDAPVVFIKNHNTADTNNIQVPLQLTLSGTSLHAPQTYYFEDLAKQQLNTATVVDVQGNGNVNVAIEKIPNQKVQNTNLITSQSSTTTHNLEFKFEYKGN